jgi:hypothetical protein
VVHFNFFGDEIVPDQSEREEGKIIEINVAIDLECPDIARKGAEPSLWIGADYNSDITICFIPFYWSL